MQPFVCRKSFLRPSKALYLTSAGLATPPPPPSPPQCTSCNATFSSRNALFKHIRFDCEDAEAIPVRHSVALFFGYTNVGAGTAGRCLLHAFLTCTDADEKELMSSTQASISKQRHPFVQQEAECPSGMDTLIVNFMSSNDWNVETAVTDLQEHFMDNAEITLHGVRQLETKLYLHAEQSCTQHLYHFMVPVNWLPGSGEIVDWHERSVIPANRSVTPPALKRFKDILRSMESIRSSTRQTEKRFGALAHKIKRPWHNYADPELRVSPNHDVSQRIMDRARFLHFQEKDGQLYIVYEFSGDGFLPQQVRRVVGTAIAIVHGWLPDDFVQTSLDRRVVVETPLAPTGYLYQAGSRFHFVELSFKGKKLFDLEDTTRTTRDPIGWIQEQLISRVDTAASAQWLHELEKSVAPRICAQLQDTGSVVSSSNDWTESPKAYTRVLQLLRDIVRTNNWPATSAGRSSVIGTLPDPTRSGSFTLVDEVHFDMSATKVPKANSAFPDLAVAVFELQQSLCSSDEQTSSHCAVNCNAQFTPHVDSGRGKGQSLSTIVGLGEYGAGEIVVEGDAHDIRYQPLQFDAWKLRHWTRPFSGERFSLVWFTPEEL